MHLQIIDSPSDGSAYGAGIGTLENTERSRPRAIGGLDLLQESTVVFDDEMQETVEFISQVMAAVVVRNGELHLHSKVLPRTIVPEDIEELVEEINKRLREAGERIESVNDLERALKLYGGGKIEIPEAASESVFRAGSKNPQSRQMGGSRSGTLRTADATDPSARITCTKMKANHAHESETKPGEIVGKASGNCKYDYGPVQTLTYNAYSYLQKWESSWWWFSYWMRVGTSGHQQETGDPVSFKQHRLVAVTPCDSGIFRTRLALYIDGSVSGPFYPHPGLYASAATSLSC